MQNAEMKKAIILLIEFFEVLICCSITPPDALLASLMFTVPYDLRTVSGYFFHMMNIRCTGKIRTCENAYISLYNMYEIEIFVKNFGVFGQIYLLHFSYISIKLMNATLSVTKMPALNGS